MHIHTYIRTYKYTQRCNIYNYITKHFQNYNFQITLQIMTISHYLLHTYNFKVGQTYVHAYTLIKSLCVVYVCVCARKRIRMCVFAAYQMYIHMFTSHCIYILTYILLFYVFNSASSTNHKAAYQHNSS